MHFLDSGQAFRNSCTCIVKRALLRAFTLCGSLDSVKFTIKLDRMALYDGVRRLDHVLFQTTSMERSLHAYEACCLSTEHRSMAWHGFITPGGKPL